MSAEDFVALFNARAGVELLFLNGCGTSEMCASIHRAGTVKVVLGWGGPPVPTTHCTAMVSPAVSSLLVGERTWWAP